MMNRYARILFHSLVPAAMLLSGCLEEHVRTTVFPDGSSERELSVKCKSKDVPRGAIPSPADSSWTVEWKETGEKDTKYEYIARKKFQTANELHREYSDRPDTGFIGLSVSITKRFQWFYTYLDYAETYARRKREGERPVISFMSKDEVVRYIRGEKSDSLQHKVDRWKFRNVFETFYIPLVAEAERRGDPRLPASLLREKKEELFNWMAEMDSTDKARQKASGKGDSTKGSINSPEDLLRLLAAFYKTDAVFGLRTSVEKIWDEMIHDPNDRPHPDGWACSVQMPGLLITTDGDAVEGNVVRWKFGYNQIEVGDYTMQATSRVANLWAFIVAGFAALLAVLAAAFAAFRRKKV